eukprot:gene16363-22302_t
MTVLYISFVTSGAAIIIYYLWSKFGRRRNPRRMSFSSSAIARGVFPPSTKSWEPVINIVLYFKECPEKLKLIKACEELLYYDRFRASIALDKNGEHVFEDIPLSSLSIGDDLIEEISATTISSCLDEICSKETHNNVSENKKLPGWKMYRIQTTQQSAPCAVIVKLHHSIGDGVSLIGTMSRIFKDLNGEPVVLDIGKKMGSSTKAKLNEDKMNEGNDKNLVPSKKSSGIMTMIEKFFKSLIGVMILANTPYDSAIRFTHPNKKTMKFGNARKTIIFPTIRLEFLKKLKNAANVTINDVLMAVTTGIIRRYSNLKQDPLLNSATGTNPLLQLRALMPIAFPRSTSASNSPSKALRNLFSLVSVDLPICSTTAKDRVSDCSIITTKMKTSPAAYLQLWIQDNIISILPKFIGQQIAYDVFTRHSMVFSNLPGPSEPFTFCDSKLLGIQAIFPNLIPQVIIISYNGDVFFNMSVDPDVIDMHSYLPSLYISELKELAESFGIETNDMLSPNVLK